jgi:hypothetical protein
MKTRELVTRLASDVSPIERNAVPRRLTRALLHGLAGSAALLVALYGVRSDMPELILTTMFWVRLAFPLAIIAAAGSVLLATPPGYRLELMLGTTWRTATANVVLLSLPSLAAILRAMKQLAPTRLALAGAGAGLLAGAQGLLAYSLYCSEMAVPFWGVWYVLAIVITTAVGSAVAPHCLRW